MPSDGTPVDDAMLRIRALEGERERLKATVEDQRQMILSWQHEAAPGGNMWNRIAELESEVAQLKQRYEDAHKLARLVGGHYYDEKKDHKRTRVVLAHELDVPVDSAEYDFEFDNLCVLLHHAIHKAMISE